MVDSGWASLHAVKLRRFSPVVPVFYFASSHFPLLFLSSQYFYVLLPLTGPRKNLGLCLGLGSFNNIEAWPCANKPWCCVFVFIAPHLLMDAFVLLFFCRFTGESGTMGNLWHWVWGLLPALIRLPRPLLPFLWTLGWPSWQGSWIPSLLSLSSPSHTRIGIPFQRFWLFPLLSLSRNLALHRKNWFGGCVVNFKSDESEMERAIGAAQQIYQFMFF